MNYTMTVKKGSEGWNAETRTPLESGMTLITTTTKNSRGGLYTYAQAAMVKNKGGWLSETYVIFQDFNKTIMKFPEVKRATERSVADAHSDALQLLPAVVESANEFYRITPHQHND